MADYETKDSGERAVFDSGMQRDTQAGKPRFDLCWPVGIPYDDQLLTRFAKLMARGAEKYTERNWEQANSQEEIDRMRASGLRHFIQWFNGERDEDHAAGAMFNMMAAEATQYKLDASNALEVEDSTLDEAYVLTFDQVRFICGVDGTDDLKPPYPNLIHQEIYVVNDDEIQGYLREYRNAFGA